MPLRSSSPARHPEKASRNRGDPSHPASSSWLLERGSRSPHSTSPARQLERRAGEPVSPPWRSEKSWRNREEPGHPPNSERGRATWQARGMGQALEMKSRGDSLHPTDLGKGSNNSGLSRAGPLTRSFSPGRSLSPGRCTESTWRSQKQISPPGPVRGVERQWVKQGEPLPLGRPGKPSECGWQTLREKLPPSHPRKSTSTGWKGQGKPLRPASPTRPLDQDWRGQGDAHQMQAWEKDWKGQEKPVCNVDLMRQLERDWKSPTKCLDVGLRPDDSWRRPESPAQRLEDNWKGPKHTSDTDNPEKPLESDWGNKRLLIYQVSRAGASGDEDPSRPKSGKHSVGGSPGWQFCAAQIPWILCCSRGAALPAWHWEGGRTLPTLACAGRRMLEPGELRQGLNHHGFSSCFLPLQPQLGGGTFPLQSSAGSSGSPQPHSNASEKRNKVGSGPANGEEGQLPSPGTRCRQHLCLQHLI